MSLIIRIAKSSLNVPDFRPAAAILKWLLKSSTKKRRKKTEKFSILSGLEN